MNDNINRSADGSLLLATTFNINVCESCDSAHFDLMDTVGNRFAAAMIGPESFREIAAWFKGAAERFEAQSGRKH